MKEFNEEDLINFARWFREEDTEKYSDKDMLNEWKSAQKTVKNK